MPRMRIEETCEESLRVSVWELAKIGLFEHGCRLVYSRGDRVTARLHGTASREFAYLTIDTAHTEGSQSIALDWQPCHLGGERPYFICPQCASVRVILFGHGRLACRTCHDLYYEKQLCRNGFSNIGKLSRIAKKLGSDTWATMPDKPKWMHWRTYEGLKADYKDALNSIRL